MSFPVETDRAYSMEGVNCRLPNIPTQQTNHMQDDIRTSNSKKITKTYEQNIVTRSPALSHKVPAGDTDRSEAFTVESRSTLLESTVGTKHVIPLMNGTRPARPPPPKTSSSQPNISNAIQLTRPRSASHSFKPGPAVDIHGAVSSNENNIASNLYNVPEWMKSQPSSAQKTSNSQKPARPRPLPSTKLNGERSSPTFQRFRQNTCQNKLIDEEPSNIMKYSTPIQIERPPTHFVPSTNNGVGQKENVPVHSNNLFGKVATPITGWATSSTNKRFRYPPSHPSSLNSIDAEHIQMASTSRISPPPSSPAFRPKLEELNANSVSSRQSTYPRPIGRPPILPGSRPTNPTLRSIPNGRITPIGPPVETVSTRVDPETNRVQRVTTKVQRFMDQTIGSSMNDLITDNTLDDGTKICIDRVTKRTRQPLTPRSSRVQSPVPTPPLRYKTIGHAYQSSSQTNLSSRPGIPKAHYASETNLRSTTTFQQAAPHSTYSAHQENLRKMSEQRRNTENIRGSVRHLTDVKPSGTEVLEETETITLQPIGRGVYDLEPPQTLTRYARSGTPVAARPYSTVPMDQSDAYRTMATTNVHREVYQNATDYRLQNSVPHHDPTIYNQIQPIYQEAPETHQMPGSAYPQNMESNLGIINPDSADLTMCKVRETNSLWYKPKCTKVQAMEMLRNKEVGSFIIRNSESHANSFSISVRISPLNSFRKDEAETGFVRSYLIALDPMPDGIGKGYSIQGFQNQPVFQNIMELVFYYRSHLGPWNCKLCLPQMSRSKSTPSGAGIAADLMYLGSMNIDNISPEEGARQAFTDLIIAPKHTGRDRTVTPCEVRLKATNRDGVVFSNQRKGIYKRLKPNAIMWCGIDPDGRRHRDEELQNRGFVSARVFGIVTRKQRLFHHENTVYLFCESDPNQEANSVISYICNELVHWQP